MIVRHVVHQVGRPSRSRARFTLGAAAGAFWVLLSLAAPVHGQELPALNANDYGRWETFGNPSIDPFARFVAHTVRRQDETTELRIVRLNPDSTRIVPWGDEPDFSTDGRWLTWTVGVSPEETRRLEAADEPVRSTGWLLELSGGEPRDLGTSRELTFDPTGRFLAVLGFAPDEPEGAGGALRILDLDEDTEVGFSNVAEFSWADGSSLLAMVLSTGADEGNGVQVYDGDNGSVRGLDASNATYSALSWRDDSSDLAVLRSPRDEEAVQADLVVWKDLGGSMTRFELAARGPAVADSLEVVAHHVPTWSDDGRRVTVGLRPRPDDAEPQPDSAQGEDSDEDPSTVQVWHSNDVRIIPRQQAGSRSDESSVLLGVWHPQSGSLVQVGQDLLAEAWMAGGHGFERRADPYAWGSMFGRPYHDLWTVDLDSGVRTQVLERARYDWVSPDGRTVVWFDGTDYNVRDPATGRASNLTEGLPAVFANTGWDTPTDNFLPPHGMGGWLENGQAVFLYDQFDVWRVAVDGSSAERLTRGAEDQVVHRMLDLHPQDEGYKSSEVHFTLRGEWTEDRGFAFWSDADGYTRQVLEPKNFRSVRKADSVDAVVYRRESRTDSPDLFVSNLSFSNPRLVSESNPFMSEYAWTRTELVEYRNAEGQRLHGVLMYPANHDASVEYPMIVYAYELLTPQTHSWEGPSERDYYNYVTWTQQGYFVLLPDIVFRARDPGVSTAETMDAAITAVAAKGVIDRDRVGFIGHSWGGYEAAYLAARTDLFATTIAGAPLTDFVSFMGSIHWNPGLAESDHWETGQARMAVPYWEDPEAHERNSPIHGVHTMTTPLLVAHGDADGVVEFFQSTEFYNFARRAEREMVLLVYEGEDHGFRQKANQIDYHRRILEWFGHYLKGEPAPKWITDGIRWSDHEKERKRVSDAGCVGC